MDIAALSIAMSQFKVAQSASISIAKLTMDNAKESMDQQVKMMEQSVNPGVGANIDIKL
ncbi:MAG: YjfB family protein [Acidaminobacteraceae bacterium]